MTPSDLELRQCFARDRAQDAFTELVRRHVNLVYSAALRQVRSPQLAEEIAQSVFADLARDAAKLGSGTGFPPVSSLAPSQTPRQRLDCACFSTAWGRGAITGHRRLDRRFHFGIRIQRRPG